MEKSPRSGLLDLDTALRAYPDDPRLHFLKGSMLASNEDFSGARREMRRAVEIAPDYGVARFQLGLLLLSSGDTVPAQEALGPLLSLPMNNYLRLFAMGLFALIRDEFEDVARLLRQGMALNRDIPPMNRDMQLLIDGIEGKIGSLDRGKPVSTVDLLLQQAALKANKH
ncbi:MAG: hypothetical protein JOZ13_00190 [Alphaproteobacteria bacterium]|nr:hypothetical protein [Alphaproteobacteria bacterium]